MRIETESWSVLRPVRFTMRQRSFFPLSLNLTLMPRRAPEEISMITFELLAGTETIDLQVGVERAMNASLRHQRRTDR